MAKVVALTVTLLSSLLFALTSAAFPTSNGRPAVTIESGVVVGVNKTEKSTGMELNAFLGVPFAAKPVRWGPPKSPAAWKTPFDASKAGPACIQQFNYPEARRNLILQWFNTPAPAESEDCLSACVYTPVTANATSRKAVMVWFYGGGLLYGSNAMPLYDGSTLAAHEDVIVVAVNYRTNVFGFPGSPQIMNNPGFLDQRFALDWVHRNIAAFGGDPSKVTIFGESAGALSVDSLITLPPKPLTFRAAIMESGTSTIRGVPTNYSASWYTLAAGVNCSTAPDLLECMRAVPATTIKQFNEINRMPWPAMFDNITSAYTSRSNRLNSTVEKPIIARVPILGGSNADEGRLYSISANDSTTFVRGLFPTATNDQIAALLAAYPLSTGGASGSSGGYLSTFSTPLEQLGALYTDFIFQCPARLVHLETAKVGIPSWRYYYNASFPNTDIFPDAGVYHSSEIGIALGTYPVANATVFQEALSRYVQHIWANFAKDPFNFKAWPKGANATGALGGGVRVEDGATASGAYLNIIGQEEMDTRVDARCAYYQSTYDILGH